MHGTHVENLVCYGWVEKRGRGVHVGESARDPVLVAAVEPDDLVIAVVLEAVHACHEAEVAHKGAFGAPHMGTKLGSLDKDDREAG